MLPRIFFPIFVLEFLDFQTSKMMKGTVAKGKRKDKSIVDEKRIKTAPRTRVGMDFDPKHPFFPARRM